jgi:hypothetical protein
MACGCARLRHEAVNSFYILSLVKLGDATAQTRQTVPIASGSAQRDQLTRFVDMLQDRQSRHSRTSGSPSKSVTECRTYPSTTFRAVSDATKVILEPVTMLIGMPLLNRASRSRHSRPCRPPNRCHSLPSQCDRQQKKNRDLEGLIPNAIEMTFISSMAAKER